MTDIEGSPETISGIDAVERLDDAVGFGVGTKWRETRTMFGKSAEEVMEVTDVVDGQSYVVEANASGVHYRTVMSVAPSPGGGSTISMTFESEPDGMLAKFMASTVGKLFERATRKAMEQDLVDIAAAAAEA